MKRQWGKQRNNDEPQILLVNSDSAASKSDIFHCNNTINFYSDIDDSNVNTLINLMHEKSFNAQGIQCQFQLPEAPPIHLHIQSYGGTIFSGIAAMEAIRNSKVQVYTYIDGMAASAATFLSVVGTKRFAYKESCILIHQLSTGFWGKFDDLEDEMMNCKMLMEKMKRIYKQYTKLDDKILNTLLKKDLYLESKDIIKYGIADEVI
jgi:ATP-dependent protease ClpP protease subunit